MKNLFLGLIVLLTLTIGLDLHCAAKPTVQTAEITASAPSPIPASFDEADPKSLVYSNGTQCDRLMVVNETDTQLYLKLTNSATAPADTIDGSIVVMAGPGVTAIFDVISIGQYWYLRGAASEDTGNVVVMCF